MSLGMACTSLCCPRGFGHALIHRPSTFTRVRMWGSVPNTLKFESQSRVAEFSTCRIGFARKPVMVAEEDETEALTDMEDFDGVDEEDLCGNFAVRVLGA